MQSALGAIGNGFSSLLTMQIIIFSLKNVQQGMLIVRIPLLLAYASFYPKIGGKMYICTIGLGIQLVKAHYIWHEAIIMNQLFG